jgi:uncharacterized protein Yka (UPF0111/DUF47 family)
MQKKLTLSIKEDLIKYIHQFAKKSNDSVSNIISKYIKNLKRLENKTDLSKRTQKLYGLFQKERIPDKKELRKYFHEKNSN